MSGYDEQLRALQRSTARKKQLEAMLQELYGRQQDLTDRADQLRTVMMSEQADVDRLECGSLTAFVYNVLGRKEEKLTKEREEAYAARVKYDAAALELSTLNEDIERKEQEWSGLQGCEEEYEQVFRQKLEEMKRQGGVRAGEIMDLERKLGFMENQSREVQEAIRAGEDALAQAQEVIRYLKSADDWATWDLFSNSVFVDVFKHDQLDQAQHQVEQLQIGLQNFRTELADVSMEIRADLNVRIDGFMRFADYFFDDIFTDITVRNRIADSLGQVQKTVDQIEYVLNNLGQKLELMDEETARTREKLERLVTDQR